MALQTPNPRSHDTQPQVRTSMPSTPFLTPPVASYPIPITAETAVFKPQRIAELWTQVLTIHIQNENSKHENTSPNGESREEGKEQVNPKAQDLDAAAEPVLPKRDTARDHKNEDEDEEDKKKKDIEHARLEKGVHYLRHTLQRALLLPAQPPITAELPKISRHLSKLESFGPLPASILLNTKIHKVCKGIMRVQGNWGMSESEGGVYEFKERARDLWDVYRVVLEEHAAKEKEKERKAKGEKEDENQERGMRITHLTPTLRAIVEQTASSYSPPLPRSVVELICILPYVTPTTNPNSNSTSSKTQTQTQNTTPNSSTQTPHPLNSIIESILDRHVYPHSPLIPPHIFPLLSSAPIMGVQLYIDTLTGEAIELKNYSSDEENTVCTTFEGRRRPIEPILEKWIRVHGSHNTHPDRAPESEQTSPTPTPSLAAIWTQLLGTWYLHHRSSPSPSPTTTTTTTSTTLLNPNPAIETLKLLDRAISKVLEYHERQIEERMKAAAAKSDLPPEYAGEPILHREVHLWGEFTIEVTPSMIMQRFNEVIGELVKDNDIDGVDEQHQQGEMAENENENENEIATRHYRTGGFRAKGIEMKLVVERAFNRWKEHEKYVESGLMGRLPGTDVVLGASESEGSDYEFVSGEDGDGDGDGEEGSWDGDEDDVDGEKDGKGGRGDEVWVDDEDEDEADELEFDVVMLEEDMKKVDIEDVRRKLRSFGAPLR